MYSAISNLYSNPRSRVILQNHSTEYFDCPVGVKQGDCLSPTLFSIYINDLAQEIKHSGIGISLEIEDFVGNVSEMIVNILLYANDIILMKQTCNLYCLLWNPGVANGDWK